MKKTYFTTVLCAVYLILLTWIIVFKMELHMDALPNIRSVNLIPFRESVIVNGKIDFTEMFNNCLVFVLS